MSELLLSLALLGAAPTIPPELAAVAAKTRTIHSLEVRMHQEKKLAAFGETLSADGTLAFARPRRLAMDLSGDGGTKLVIDGDQMMMHYKALAKTERLSLAKDPRARAVAEHLFLLLDADPVALAEIYHLEVRAAAPLLVRLKPKSPALARLIAHVDARFDARGFVDEMTMTESGGDTTRWLFRDPVLNREPSPELFKLVP